MNDVSYPVVTERVLAPVAPKKLFGKGPTRRADEVPEPLAGHCLVYRTRGQYTVDTYCLPPDSPTVVEATHVSVVDTTVDTKIAVELPLPSRDASFFTLRVTFLCTVDDPAEVVRAGGQSAESLLAGYLRGHQRIFEIGLDYGVDDLNDVRRKLSAQVRAYSEVNPPDLRGMKTNLASVEVSTPDDVIEFHDQLRAKQRDYVVKTEELVNSEHLDDIKEQQQYRREQRSSEHTRRLDADQREHHRTELRRTAEAVGTDPFAALTLAHTTGEVGAKEFAEKISSIREKEIEQDREDLRNRIQYDRQHENRRWAAEREDRRKETEQRALTHETELRQLEASKEFERERIRAKWDAKIARQRAEWEADEANRVQVGTWAHEEKQIEREAMERKILAKMEVLREFAKHGQLDMLNLKLDEVANDMLAIESKSDESAPAVTQPEAEPASDDGEPDDDRTTRVEA